jgi:hypothetical protein
MKLYSKKISSQKLLLVVTIYFVASFASFWIATSGYLTLFFVFGIAPLYPIIWILLIFATFTSKKLRYAPILIYLTLLIQLILTFLNTVSGRYVLTNDLYLLSSNIYLWILASYDALLIFSTISLFRLKSMHPEDRR